MPTLTPATHRALDWIVVAVFALAPWVLGLDGLAEAAAYVLAVLHAVVTVVTSFPMASGRPLPLRVHGTVELVVAAVLLVAPWFLLPAVAARIFFAVIGALLLIVWRLTPYGAGEQAARA